MKVALVQGLPELELEDSRKSGLEHCRRAAAWDPDVILFPEMWSVGYSFPTSEAGVGAWRAKALLETDSWFDSFREFAKASESCIVMTFLERADPLPRNSLVCIGTEGETLAAYSKVHTCEFDVERLCAPGAGFRSAILPARDGPFNAGFAICFDREFPESFRSLMIAGAELALVPNACELERNRMGQLRARAFENMMGVAVANYAGEPNRGHSAAFDCISYRHDGSSRDTLVIEAGESEGVYLADFDLEAIRNFRRSEVWGDAYRKPYAYAPVLRRSDDPCFRRADARREAE